MDLKRNISFIVLIFILLLGMSGCGTGDQRDTADVSAETSADSGAQAAAAAVKTISAEGVEMDYIEFGSGEKSFVILPGLSVHSVMGSADAIAEAYSVFTEDYTVYVFDVPKTISEDYSLKNNAEDIASVMKALGIEKADILGVSMGGMSAVYLAASHPELVNKMVLGSTFAAQNDTFNKVVREWTEMASEKNEDALLESFADHVYSEGTLEAYRDVIISSNKGITDEEYQRFLIMAEACSAFDCIDELPLVKCPVLVIGSEGDRIVTAEGSKKLAEALGCDLFMYDDSFGHGVYDEAPDYKQRCLDFFKG